MLASGAGSSIVTSLPADDAGAEPDGRTVPLADAPETDKINANSQKIFDVATLEWGVEVNLVELKDIQLPDSMKRAMARQAEAEREKRAKIIAAEGESIAAAALGEASDTMMAHPLALQLRNLKNSGRTRRGEEHHGGVPCADDERDRRDQQFPHSGNRRRTGHHNAGRRHPNHRPCPRPVWQSTGSLRTLPRYNRAHVPSDSFPSARRSRHPQVGVPAPLTATTSSLSLVGCPPLACAAFGIPDRPRGHFPASGPAAHARTEYVPDRQRAVNDQRDVGFCWGRNALLGRDGD
jgi:hypothetical protein